MDFNYKDLFKKAFKSTFDDLNILITILLIISLVVSFFIKNFIIDLIPFILFALVLYRLLSKNKAQRRKENDIYLKIKNFFVKPFKTFKEKDYKHYVYKRCRKCKTILKLPLPKKAGINHAKCPECGNRVTILNIRHEKIKVEKIKKRKDT